MNKPKMGRPRKGKHLRVTHAVRLDPQLIARAKRVSRSFNAAVETALTRFVETEEVMKEVRRRAVGQLATGKP